MGKRMVGWDKVVQMEMVINGQIPGRFERQS